MTLGSWKASTLSGYFRTLLEYACYVRIRYNIKYCEYVKIAPRFVAVSGEQLRDVLDPGLVNAFIIIFILQYIKMFVKNDLLMKI